MIVCKTKFLVIVAFLTIGLAACQPSIHDMTAQAPMDAVRARLETDDMAVNARNYKQKTPLFFAVSRGDAAFVALLIEKGAAVNAADETGLTPLHVAVMLDRREMVRLLLDAGADMTARDDFGDTPLHDAGMYGRTNMVRELIGRGMDPMVRNGEDLTPAQLAARHGQGKAQALIEALGGYSPK